MALELVGGAALGAVFEKLFVAVVDARTKATKFDSSLKKLEETLKSINPSILEMKRMNDQLDRPKEEMEKLIQILKDGEKLIHKCSKVSCCNYFKKWRYANEIEALEDSLLKIFQVELQAQLSRNNMQILVLLKSNRFSWSNRGVSVKYESLGSCEATDPPDFMVGLDVPLKELKRWLFTDGESRIVVSAPGGCGKTTLAKRLCHDQQVKGIPTKSCFLFFPFILVNQIRNIPCYTSEIHQNNFFFGLMKYLMNSFLNHFFLQF